MRRIRVCCTRHAKTPAIYSAYFSDTSNATFRAAANIAVTTLDAQQLRKAELYGLVNRWGAR